MQLRLKALREDRDIKQQEIADLLGMTQQNYQRIESEKVALSFSDAIKLAEFFDVSLEELVVRDSIKQILTKEEYKKLKEAALLLLSIEDRFKK